MVEDKLKKIEEIYNDWKGSFISTNSAMSKIGDVLKKRYIIKNFESLQVVNSEGEILFSSDKGSISYNKE